MSRVQPKQPPNIFQYTNNVGPLTIEQRAFYEENGFLIVRSVFDRNELEPIAKHYFDICRNPSAYCGKVCGNVQSTCAFALLLLLVEFVGVGWVSFWSGSRILVTIFERVRPSHVIF